MTRVYVPTTAEGLVRLVSEGVLGPTPLRAYAVTQELTAWWGDAGQHDAEKPDDEELEYAAMLQAGGASLAMLAFATMADDSPPARRIVIAADVPDVAGLQDPQAVEGSVPGELRLAEELPMTAVAAVHVDGDGAVGAVRKAASVLADYGIRYGSGEPSVPADAEQALATLSDHELEWFEPGEVADLIDLLDL